MKQISEGEYIDKVINEILQSKSGKSDDTTNALTMDNPTNNEKSLHHLPSSKSASASENWQVVRSKRQISPDQPTLPNSSNRKYRKITEYMAVSNRFDSLPTADTEPHAPPTAVAKIQRPPPIYIPGVDKIVPVQTLIEGIAGKEYTLKMLRNNQVKVQVSTEEAFRNVVSELVKQNKICHTFQLKSERKYRVVIRNIHFSTDQLSLKEEIESYGHVVANIHNARHRLTKEPLSMFYVDLVQSPNNKKIFEIKYLQHTKIEIEPPRAKRDIPQCLKCQRYGHTQNYCYHDARCVKCGASHTTKSCTKIQETQAACVLCKGPHPANYKGCTVYKEIQSKKFPPPRPREQVFPVLTATNSFAAKPRPSSVNPNVSFAQIVRQIPDETTNNEDCPPFQAEHNNTSKLEVMMMKLMDRMDNMLSLLTTMVTKLVNVPNP